MVNIEFEDHFQENATSEGEKRMQGLWSKRRAYNILWRKLQFDVIRTGVTFLRMELETKLSPQERSSLAVTC
jgi:hypothetical protein